MTDVLVEPTRSILIPDFYKLRSLAMKAGAVGFGISGSGPSVFALTKDKETALQITGNLQQHLKNISINSLAFVSEVNKKGPVILD
ncbi:Homoserine kinase [compost metagenome]